MTATLLPQKTNHLTALSSEKDNLLLEPTSGRRTFVTQRAMFPGGFDGDFEGWGTDVPSEPTGKIIPVVYEMTEDGDFQTILEPFGDSIWVQDPALQFIERYSSWLHPDGWATFLPFIVGKKRFVARVYRRVGRLGADVDLFGSTVCGLPGLATASFSRNWLLEPQYKRDFVSLTPGSRKIIAKSGGFSFNFLRKFSQAYLKYL